MTNTPDLTLLSHLTAEIVKAYVSQNKLNAADLPALISSTHSALQGLGQPEPEPVVELKPAVPIKKSITPDYIISLEDGRQYRTLKKHLSGLGLTPEQYREKWGLPSDYPMVSQSYSAQRSQLAKSLGLGRKRTEEVEAQQPVAEPVAAAEAVTAPEEPKPSPEKPKRKKIGLRL
jgi:predicted transcriptional regulator